MTVGVGYVMVCQKCGNGKTLYEGCGYIPPESFKDDILEGRFGQDAKEIMEEHPEWPFLVEQEPFSCRCNYITSFTVVSFLADDGTEIRCDRHRCSQCGKVLRANSKGKGICWKCGGPMIASHRIFWD